MIITDKKCSLAKSIARFNTTLLAEVAGPVTEFEGLRVKRISKEKGQLIMWEKGFEDVIIEKSEIQFVRVFAYNVPTTRGTNGFKYSTYVDVIINGHLNRLKIQSSHVLPEAKRAKIPFNGSIPVVSGWVRDPSNPKERDDHFSDPLCPEGYLPLVKEYVEAHISLSDSNLRDLNIDPSLIVSPQYLMENPCNFDEIKVPDGFVMPNNIDYTVHEVERMISKDKGEDKPKKEKKPKEKKELKPLTKKAKITIASIAGAVLVISIVLPIILLNPYNGPAATFHCADVVSPSGESGLCIKKYNGNYKDVNIPKTISGKKVVEISESAFLDNKNIERLSIPDTVEKIGFGALKGCSSLERVSVPFVGETKTTNTYLAYIFGDPERGALNQEYVPNSLSYVFIDEGCTLIDDYAFYGCRNISSVYFPDTLTSIGDYALARTSFFSSGDLIKNKNIVHIGKYAFQDTNIHDMNITENIKEISEGAFSNCHKLERVEFSSSLETIGDYSFEFCESLNTIRIPNQVKRIGLGAFAHVPFESITAPFTGESRTSNRYVGYWFGAKNPEESDSYVPNTLKSVSIRESVTDIPDYCYFGCESYVEQYLKDGIVSIGKYAFAKCHSLSLHGIPDSVKTIGEGAFKECENVKIERFPNGTEAIGDYAFQYNSSLKNVLLPAYLKTLGKYAYASCNLTSVTIQRNIESIGDYAFYGNQSLSSIEFFGTKEQWNAVQKGSNWAYATFANYVKCYDGNVAI